MEEEITKKMLMQLSDAELLQLTLIAYSELKRKDALWTPMRDQDAELVRDESLKLAKAIILTKVTFKQKMYDGSKNS